MPLNNHNTRLARLEQETGHRTPRPPADLLAGTFKHQRNFIQDQSQLKWAKCTRRAAKSYSVGLDLMQTTHEQEGACLYVGLTRESSKRIMWRDVLKQINRKHRLGFKFNETSLVAESSTTGSPIYMIGADSNEDEKQKALGQKYRRVYVDEAQAFTIDLRELVYGILKPAVADYRGVIGLTGTPGNLLKGLFFDLTNGKEPGWSGHTWNTFDNPYMAKQWKAEIDALIAGNPRVVETPWFKQNYLGEWVIEQDKLVYRYNPGRNSYVTPPQFSQGHWRWVLGVDLGYNDATAFAVTAYHEHSKVLYICETFKESKLDITGVANKIKRYRERYDFDTIVVDGANKQAVAEMQNRHGLPLRPADKRGKPDFIELMNSDFIQGNIVLGPDCTPLADEYLGLIWDDRGTRRQEHPNCPNHLADAALYAWRYCHQYLASPQPIPPTETDLMLQAAEERLIAAQQLDKEGMSSDNWEWQWK